MGKPADFVKSFFVTQREHEYATHNIIPAQTSPGHVTITIPVDKTIHIHRCI